MEGTQWIGLYLKDGGQQLNRMKVISKIPTKKKKKAWFHQLMALL